jgi:molybdenum cofactor cytidylyltransferase
LLLLSSPQVPRRGWAHPSNYCNGNERVYCDRLQRQRSLLGASGDKIQAEVSDLPVQIVTNPEWQTGMGSSIRTGIQALVDRHPAVEAAILLLCDQPFVSPQIIWQLRSIYDATHQSIVASSYQNTLGVPALFDRHLFSELLELDRLEGAKTVIKRYLDTVETIDFPQGSIDIDTPQDYQFILSKE